MNFITANKFVIFNTEKSVRNPEDQHLEAYAGYGTEDQLAGLRKLQKAMDRQREKKGRRTETV